MSEDVGIQHQDLLDIFNEESVILDILEGNQKLTKEQDQKLIKRFT